MLQQKHYTSTEAAFPITKESNKNVYLTEAEMQQIDHEVSLLPYHEK